MPTAELHYYWSDSGFCIEGYLCSACQVYRRGVASCWGAGARSVLPLLCLPGVPSWHHMPIRFVACYQGLIRHGNHSSV